MLVLLFPAVACVIVLLYSLLLLVPCVTTVPCVSVFACVPAIAGVPDVVGIPAVAVVSAVDGVSAVADISAIAGVPSIAGVLVISSIPAHPGVSIFVGVFTYYLTIALWISGCYLLLLLYYQNIEHRTGKFEKLSDYRIWEESLNLRLSDVGHIKNHQFSSSAEKKYAYFKIPCGECRLTENI